MGQLVVLLADSAELRQTTLSTKRAVLSSIGQSRIIQATMQWTSVANVVLNNAFTHRLW